MGWSCWWSSLGAYTGPWPARSRSLQGHHTLRPITFTLAIASSDAIRPGRLGGFPPARQDVHAGSSVVAGPWQANILGPSLFAAYSLLSSADRPSWRRRLGPFIRLRCHAGPICKCMHASFGQNGLGSHETGRAKSSRP